MTPAEIHVLLNEHFPGALTEFSAPAAGDPWLAVSAAQLPEVSTFLRDDPALAFDYLRLITAADLGDSLASIYHLYSYKHQHEVVLRVTVDRSSPAVPSLSNIWPAADWLEREAYDMLGIVYEGHPELTRILLPLDWEGYPLRKDYEQPEEYHGIKHD